MSVTPKLGKGLGRIRDIERGPDRPEEKTIEPWSHLGIGAPLPTSIDVFAGLALPIYDQGQLGSCTADAGVLYRRFLAQRFSQFSARDQDLSRLFLYYQERKLPWNSDVGSDSGASVRDAMYVLAYTGVCPESDDPYVTADFADPNQNSSADLTAAVPYRIGAYHRVPDVDTARSVLASGYAIQLGFTVYESFESIGPDGVMPMPAPGEQVLGGHSPVMRGYDDTREMFFVQNSWGESWGANGCFWMPYAFLENASMSQADMWIGHMGKPWS
jgi:C1A family cysteine protease